MSDEHRKALRDQHTVRLVNPEEEGSGLHRLPNGVYGFTFAPGFNEAPLFREPRFHSFEVHKLPDGTVVLIGFVSPEAAAHLQAYEPAKIRLLPDSTDQAQTPVALPLWRIRRHREHSAREGEGLEIELVGGKM